MSDSPRGRKLRGRLPILRSVRPSYLILVLCIPFVVLLFASSSDYQAALRFIAPGIRDTVLATLFGYLGAAVLGLALTGLLLLQAGVRSLLITGGLALALLAGAVALFAGPRVDYALVGDLAADGGRIAIVQGTPLGQVRPLQEELFPREDGARRSTRAVTSVDEALELLADDDRVTAAFVPASAAPAGAPVLYEARFLPTSLSGPATVLAVLGTILGLLAFAGWQAAAHPLAIFAELYVDLLRGLPMLVVILYVGFPLQGAIRDATGGIVDMSRLTRGVVAISLGYAAYMAEIFRAGIEAIPRGQIEASRSLGLSGWQTARFVVLPQALRIVTPPLGNEFVAMLKDTSLLSVLSLREVTQRAREYQATNFDPFPPFNTAALLYIGLTLAASSALRELERRTERDAR